MRDSIRRLAGAGVLIGVVATSATLDAIGRARQPVDVRLAFAAGTQLATEALAELDRLAHAALTRPSARVVLAGHSGTRGEAAANRALSLQRAERIADELVERGVERERIATLGLGATAPLRPGEDEDVDARGYQRRLARVEAHVRP